MYRDKLTQKDQAEIVKKLTSRLREMGVEEEFDEDLYSQLDERHKIQVDEAITEFANGAIGSDHWDSDE